MTAYGNRKSSIQDLIGMLRTELAWYPGRPVLVARMVLACTAVVVMAEVFRIPGAVLGAGFPILISRENPEASRKSAFQIGMACSIATAGVIVGGILTAGSPFLHVMWVLVSLFAAFYAISSLNFSSASLTGSVVVGIAIRVWDYPIRTEARVVSTLYTLLSILIACVVTALIETVYAKKNPPDAVLEGVSLRLNLVATLLNQATEKEFASRTLALQISRSAGKGVDDLWELTSRSSYETAFRDLLATVIALTGQLIELSSHLVESAPHLSVDDQERCRSIARNLDSIRSSLMHRVSPEWIALPIANRTNNPILMEIERTTSLIGQSFCDETFRIHCCSPEATVAKAVSGPVATAHQHTVHFKFAVRGTLSAFLCYVFYMSAGWMGLGPSIVTCMLVARRLTGASRHRQVQRFAGFLVGAGVLGWGTEVFLLPQLDSLVEYVLLFASVVWIGSWVATSGPRIAFSGFQMVLAYNLVSLNTFTINTSLVPARDVVLAIMLGFVAMWLVFDHLWAQTSGASVRNLLLGTLRRVAQFKSDSADSPAEANQRLIAESSKINREFDKLRDVADFYAFESFPKKPHESLVNRTIQTLLPEVRALLLIKTGLLQQRQLNPNKALELLIQDVEVRTSNMLLGLANAIEVESPDQLSAWSLADEELRARVSLEETTARDSRNLSTLTEMRLCASLLDLTSDLERQARANFLVENGRGDRIGDWTVGTIAET